MPRKIKVQRKDVNEPDEFISTSSRVMAYVKARYRLLAPAAGAVLLLVLIAVVWYYYRAGREQEARASFHQAVALYQAAGPAETTGLQTGSTAMRSRSSAPLRKSIRVPTRG